MFWKIGVTVLITAAISTVGYLLANWENTIGKMKATYNASIPKDNYVEVPFDTWLDWFTIAHDKWIFKKRNYNDYYCWTVKHQVEIPARKVVRMNRIYCEPFIKFSYKDFKKFRKWYEQYETDKAHKAKLERQENLRQEVHQNTIELFKAVQGDIDAYKAKIDGEMDDAMNTCRDVSERINNEIAQKGNVKDIDWNRHFAEWLTAYKRGEMC